MKNIWVRIGLTAGAVFGVGMLVVYGVRTGKAEFQRLVNSSDDIHIPLMGIVPFQLGDQRLGELRRLTLLRDTPQHLTGVRVEARLSDSAVADALTKDCAFLTVNDPQNLNGRTRFACVTDTAGLGDFGTVEIVTRQGGAPTTLVRTLLLPAADVRQLQQAMGPRVSPDSATLADMRHMGDSLRAMGDSIRAATRVQVEIAREQARQAGRPSKIQIREVPPPAPPTPSAPKP